MALQQRLLSKRLATIAAALALAGGRLLAQATVGEVSPAGALVARTTVSEHPPDWLVAALVSKKAEIEATVVTPCKTKREQSIAPERDRLTHCSDCSGQLPQLAIIERQALARCDTAGIYKRIADVDERKDAVVARLGTLIKQFQQQAQANAALSDEIKDGQAEAWVTFKEAAVGQIMGQLLNSAPEKQMKLIEAAEEKLLKVKAVSRVTKGELGVFVAEMKAELAGKSNAEARAMIVARLEKVTLQVSKVRSVNLAQGLIASHSLDKVLGAKPDVTGEALDAAYASLVTALQIDSDLSAKSAKTILGLKAVYVLGFFGYALDAVKIGAVFGNIYRLQQNVEGLSSLARAAESQRKTAKLELDYLVKVRRELVEERENTQHVAGP